MLPSQWLEKIDWTEELFDYIRLPSVSSQQEDVRRTAQFAQKLLAKSGIESRLIETSGNPVVIGENNGNGPEILIYGHYDVQPPGNREMWNTDPFEPVLKDGKIWGRGSADNKGQHYAYLLALRYLKEYDPETFKRVKIKIILDGDEERGSFSLPPVLKEMKQDLKADLILISDGPSLVYDKPTLVGSVRGIFGFQITIKHGKDLHSGNFGGISRSATTDLIHLLQSMVDKNGKSKIEGFYDDVEPPSANELQYLQDLEPIYQNIMETAPLTPAPKIDGKDNKFLNQFYPTFNINGLSAGGVDGNRRTIIPGMAKASIDCRMVPNMSSRNLKRLIENHVYTWAEREGISQNVSIEYESPMEPVTTSLDSSYVDLIKEGLETGFLTSPVIVPRLGGSLPTYLFPLILEAPTFLVPFALPDENNHAPNENLDVEYFKKGVLSSISILQLLAKKTPSLQK